MNKVNNINNSNHSHHNHGNHKKIFDKLITYDLTSFINKSFYTINPCDQFIDNWHIELIAKYLEAANNGKIKRIIINIPPRSLKTISVSVAFPAWILGHSPSKRIISASYSSIISEKNNMDCKFLVNSEWYKNLFPSTIISKKCNRKNKFMTNKNGFLFSTSVGGSVTGEGADILIIDDPHNPSHIYSKKLRHKAINWFNNSFASRLNNKKEGIIILVMQRLHIDDLSAYLLQNSNEWTLLKIPVIADKDLIYNIGNKKYFYYQNNILHKKRDSKSTLNSLKLTIGKHNFAAQYMQSPLNSNCNFVNEKEISFYETINNQDLQSGTHYYIHSWDTAIKTSINSDYTVGTIWLINQENQCYLIKIIRGKFSYPELKKQIIKSHNEAKAKNILIEDKASGQSLIQDLKLAGYDNIIPIKVTQDKITRFASVSDYFANDIIKLPKNSVDIDIIIDEITNFPNSKNDDIVDSISQFLNYYKNHIANINISKNHNFRIRKL